MSEKQNSSILSMIDESYWFLMIVATTMGEIIGNLVSRDLALGYSTGTILLTSIFAIGLLARTLSTSQHPLFYWTMIMLGNIAGTDNADLITRTLGLGNAKGSLLVIAVLCLTIYLWRSTKKIHRHFETTFYWLSILFSSILGTTIGDFLSSDTPLRSSGGSVLLLIILLIMAFMNKSTKVSKSTLYWLALVTIHPIGATIGNYISKPEGFNWGNIWTSVGLMALFVAVYRHQKRINSLFQAIQQPISNLNNN